MIESVEALRQLYPQASARSRAKQLDRLDEAMRRFVAHAPLCVLASAGTAGGLLDASPRGGPPGFVQVADERTLLIPDATGNNRLDTLENLVADPRIGVLFLVPGVDEVLRVNGAARLRDEALFTQRFATPGATRLPALVIEVMVCLSPVEASPGARPRNAPIELPSKRVQSPTSTASPNPVKVAIPRRQHNRFTTSVNSLLAAISSICRSRPSRRAAVNNTSSNPVSNAAWVPYWSNLMERSHRSWSGVHAFPPVYT